MNRYFLIFSTILALAVNRPSLKAFHTEKFFDDTFFEFEEGETHGIALTTDGFLTLGPTIEKWCSLPVSVVWATVSDSKGNLYVAAGNEGQIFKIDEDGKINVFFKANELQIQALSLDSNDNLYAASLPDGKVYRIDEKGVSSVFFDPKEKYIWAMQFDSLNNLFIATGDKGKLYKVSPSGDASLFYDSDETHMRTLLLDKQKHLWVGTDDHGLVYRFDHPKDNESTPFVVYDSYYREIKSLISAADGSIFITAMGDGKPTTISFPTNFKLTPPTPPNLSPVVSTDSNPTPAEPALKVEELHFNAASDGKTGASEIVKINADGSTENWWNHNEDIFALSLMESGKLWAGTGQKAKLLELQGPKEFSILGQLEAEAITSILSNHKDSWLVTTSNPAVIWKISHQNNKEGTFESKIFNAHKSSRWGNLEVKLFQTSGKVTFWTRSGNTSKPDKVWNPWEEVDEKNHITSPMARYLQYKVQVKDSLSKNDLPISIDSVAIYYQHHNQPPQISRISILPSNVDLVKVPKQEIPMPLLNPNFGPTAPSHGPKQVQQESSEDFYAYFSKLPMLQQIKKLGWRAAIWQANDFNNDELRHDVFYRSAGFAQWKILKQNLDEPFVSWDSATWPDGDYYLKIVTTDLLSNHVLDTKTDQLISGVFTIDNTTPTIQVDDPEKTKDFLLITISDMTNVIDQAEFSLDGQEWRPLLPTSGLYDSKSNKFIIPIDNLKDGDHYAVIRASDAANNITSQTIKFQK